MYKIAVNSNSWEFPILAKYGFAIRKIRPFIGAGPSFRLLDHPGNRSVSNAGVAAGAGVDLRVLHVQLDPEIRYTYWTADPRLAVNAHFASLHNQAELIVGLLF